MNPRSGVQLTFRSILPMPWGSSIDDGIDSKLCSLHYIIVDMAMGDTLRLDRGALLAKIDIEHAYSNVPVHSDDHHLLGMYWKGHTFIDTTLPFGLHSAPKIFTALEWVLLPKRVSTSRHYLR